MSWALLNAKTKLPICEYDSIEEVEDNARATVPTEPQEGGFFYSYDKVHGPVEVSVTLGISGDYPKQQSVLQDVEALRRGLTLCTLVTPTGVRENLAMVGVSTSRSSGAGANSLSIAIELQEVLSAELAEKGFKWSPKNPTSANVLDGGAKKPRESLLSSATGLGTGGKSASN